MYNTINESLVTVYVLPVVNKIVILKTEKMKETAIAFGKPIETETSEGMLLPLDLAQTIGNGKTFDTLTTVETDLKTTSDKARESERVFNEWAKARGYTVTMYEDRDHQLKGIDAEIQYETMTPFTVQLKYDGKAYKTKNLYVEFAEVNPTHSH